MNIIIKTKNIRLTESLEKYINDKIGKLARFMHSENTEVFVEVKKETIHHKKGDMFSAQLVLSMDGKKLVVKAHGEDLLKVIIKSKDEMEIEIKKHKTRNIEESRRKIRKSLDRKTITFFEYLYIYLCI